MFNLEQGKNFFLILKQVFDRQCLALNQLDAVIGDGDHGTTMQRGVNEISHVISRTECRDFAELFDCAAISFAEGSGGAIGPILSAFFAEGGTLFKDKTALSTQDLAALFKNGAEAIMQVGGASPGEKTILDAIVPAYENLAAHENESPAELLEKTWQITRNAAEGTKTMLAKQGRARFLKENSITFQDPGATSFAWMVYALWKAAGGESPASGEEEPPRQNLQPHVKFINSPEDMVRQDNRGLALAYPKLVKYSEDGVLIRVRSKDRGKTGIAIGHGGGHTPSMGGFVGPGLLDADVYGPIYTCAAGVNIFKAVQHADRGSGVVLLVSNHSGDVLNARLAARRAEQAGIPLEMVLCSDDVATAPRSQILERRGLGGLLFTLKIGGAAAEQGDDLHSVASLMRATNERTASLSVALNPSSETESDHLEIGTGVHGEAGVYSGTLKSADDVVNLVMGKLIKDLESFTENRYLIFINGSGGTSLMELHILFQKAYDLLMQYGIQPAGSVVGSFFTTADTKGFSISLCVLTDEMEMLWNEPASGPCFHWPYE